MIQQEQNQGDISLDNLVYLGCFQKETPLVEIEMTSFINLNLLHPCMDCKLLHFVGMIFLIQVHHKQLIPRYS